MKECVARFLAVVTIAGGVCASAAAQTITPAADGTFSVQMVNVPLLSALRAVAEILPFQKLTLDPDVETAAVNVNLERVTLGQALPVILKSAGVNYVLAGAATGQVRLAAGNRAVMAAGRPEPNEARPEKQRAAESAEKPLKTFAETEKPVGQADPVAEDERRAQLERALTATLPAGVHRGFIELPFPNPDGTPQIVVLPPAGTVAPGAAGALPFPAMPGLPTGTAAATATPGVLPTPQQQIESADQQLNEALKPKSRDNK